MSVENISRSFDDQSPGKFGARAGMDLMTSGSSIKLPTDCTRGPGKLNFLLSQPKHMLWVLKRVVM